MTIVKNNIPKQNRNDLININNTSNSSSSSSTIIHNGPDVIDTLTNMSTVDALSANLGRVLNEIKIGKEDIVDDLLSTNIDKPLSANQGKILDNRKLNIGSVVNNLTSNYINQPLSANLGKVLNDSKLSKVNNDTISGKITLNNTLTTNAMIRSKQFDIGTDIGLGIYEDKDGRWNLHVDNAKIRGKLDVQLLSLDNAKYVGGKLIFTLAAIKITSVSNYGGNWYRCYFKNTDDEGTVINNNFISGDMAFCQSFNNNKPTRWWRGVARTGPNYIDVVGNNTAGTFEVGSDLPKVGDEVIQLGNLNDVSRQNAIIISCIDNAAPSIIQYTGINSFSLVGKDATRISPDGNKFKGDFYLNNGKSIIAATNENINLSIKEYNGTGENLYQSNTLVAARNHVTPQNPTNSIYHLTSNGFKVFGVYENKTYVLLYTPIKDPGYYTLSFRAKCLNFNWNFDVKGSYFKKDNTNVDKFLGSVSLIKGQISDFYSFTLYVDPSNFRSGPDAMVYFWIPYFGATEYQFYDVKVERGKYRTTWCPSDFDKLYDTGINIDNKEVVITADKFKIQNTIGTSVFKIFDDSSGIPMIHAKHLDIDNIKAENCQFKYGSMSGILTKEPIELNQTNINSYLTYNRYLDENVLDLSKLGSLIIVKGNFTLNYQINLPGGHNSSNLTLNEFKYIGSLIVIINKTNDQLMICGETHSGGCYVIYPNQVCSFQCTIKKSVMPYTNGFIIGWEEIFRDDLNPASLLAE